MNKLESLCKSSVTKTQENPFPVFNEVDNTIIHLCRGIQSTAAGTQGVPELTNALAALVTARANARIRF